MKIEYKLEDYWIIIYTKDIITQEQYDQLERIVKNPTRKNILILPSELIDRVEYIENPRVKLFNLLKKIKGKKNEL